MPVLEISNGEGNLAPTIEPMLIAVMAYPDDEEMREQLYAILVTDWALSRQDERLLSAIAPQALPWTFYAPSPSDVYQRARKRLESARVAAELANFALRASLGHPASKPTLTKAVSLLADSARRAEREASTLWDTAPVSERWIWKSWNRYRSVAHLHIPGQLLPPSSSQTPEVRGATVEDVPLPAWRMRLLLHLAHAELLRQALEGIGILSPEETWRSPPDLLLPQIHVQIPALEAWQVEALASYRPRFTKRP